MIDQDKLSQFSNLFSQANDILVIFPATASLDQVATALALAEALAQQQKQVLLASTQEVSLPELGWGGVEYATQIGKQNLSISFPYNPEQVDKVSYHIGEETGQFFLTIKPQKGVEPLNYEAVEFSYTGTSADLIITVGVSQLEDLLQLYFGYEDFYRDTQILSIHSYDTNHGTAHFDVSGYSSYSEAIARLINDLGLPLTDQTATNLITGIDAYTNGFQSLTTTADTFETVARLLRSGGRRKKRHEATPVAQSNSATTEPTGFAQAMQLPHQSSAPQPTQEYDLPPEPPTQEAPTPEPPASQPPKQEFTPRNELFTGNKATQSQNSAPKRHGGGKKSSQANNNTPSFSEGHSSGGRM